MSPSAHNPSADSVAKTGSDVQAVHQDFGSLTRYRFRCTHCGTNGVRRTYEPGACICGATLVVWPAGAPSPIHGWHGPCVPTRTLSHGRIAKRKRRYKRKGRKQKAAVKATADMFAVPFSPLPD